MLNVVIDIERLKQEINKRLLKETQEELAKKTGFSRQYIAKLHKGEINPHPKTYKGIRHIYRLCKKLNINFNKIVISQDLNESIPQEQDNEQIPY
jgi:predicted transcriptional regulator